MVEDDEPGFQAREEINVQHGGLVHERVFLDRARQVGDAKRATSNFQGMVSRLSGSWKTFTFTPFVIDDDIKLVCELCARIPAIIRFGNARV